MIIWFFSGIGLVLLFSILVSKADTPTKKKIFAGGIIAGFLMMTYGFGAFAPEQEKQEDVQTSTPRNESISETSYSEIEEESTDYSEDEESVDEEYDSSENTNSFDSDFSIERFLKEHTKYSDINVSGSYLTDPFGAVITVDVSDKDDKRQVVSKILSAFYEHSDDKLNNFDTINIIVDDGEKRLKTEYLVSTITGNPKVYRLTQVQSLAMSWSTVPSPN